MSHMSCKMQMKMSNKLYDLRTLELISKEILPHSTFQDIMMQQMVNRILSN